MRPVKKNVQRMHVSTKISYGDHGHSRRRRSRVPDLRLSSRTFIALFLIASMLTPMIPVGSGWRSTQVASGGTESGNNADSSIGCFELAAASSESPSVVRCALESKDDTYVDNLLPKKTFGHEFVLVVQNTPRFLHPRTKHT